MELTIIDSNSHSSKYYFVVNVLPINEWPPVFIPRLDYETYFIPLDEHFTLNLPVIMDLDT